jgi:hypothetical protein
VGSIDHDITAETQALLAAGGSPYVRGMAKHEKAAAFVRGWKFMAIAAAIWLGFTVIALLSFLDDHEVIHGIMLGLGSALTVGYATLTIVTRRKKQAVDVGTDAPRR